MGLGEEEQRHQVPFSSCHKKGTCYQPKISLWILTLITWLREYWSGFSTVMPLFLPLSILYSWGRSHFVQPTLKSVYAPPPAGVSTQIIWNSAWEICLFSPIYLSSIIHLYQYKYTDSYFILWIIIQYCSDFSSFGYWLFHSPPMSLWYIPIIVRVFSWCHKTLQVHESAISSRSHFFKKLWFLLLKNGMRNQWASVLTFTCDLIGHLLFHLEKISFCLWIFWSVAGNTLMWYIKVTFLAFSD